MAQLSYDVAPARGYAGDLADNGPKDFLSRINGEASAQIPFGVAVAIDTADVECDLPAAAGDKILGVCVRSDAYQPGMSTDGTLGTSGINIDTQVSVLRKGRVYLVAEEDVVPGDRLCVRYASGAGGTQLGAWRKTPVTSETINTTRSNVVVLTTAAAGAVFVAEVDFTVNVTAQVTAAIQAYNTQLAAAVLAADSSGTVATFESTLITAINAITVA